MLAACAPTLYKKPVANFEKATRSARDVYFSQLASGHESFLIRRETKLKLDILSDENYDYSSEIYLLQKEKLAELNSEKSIPAQSLQIRQHAFEVLEYYGKTLQTLASDEKTEALKTELTGFTGDLKKLIQTTESLIAGQAAFEFLKPVSAWTGPLSAAIGVLNGLIDIISDAFREKAIRQTVIKSDPMVQDLLVLLQEEAVTAAEFQRNNYDQIVRECGETLKRIDFAASAEKYLANDLCTGVELKRSQLPAANELEEVFQLVRASHGEMKKLAEGGDFDLTVKRIRHFQKRIEHLKTKFDILMKK
jgi:hypothetical protein